MAGFMLAWELGSDLGHAMPLAQLATTLLQRGHQVHLAWKDLSICRNVLGPACDAPGLHLWQAPQWPGGLVGLHEPATYPELLFTAGYRDPDPLWACARAWRQLFEATQPELLVADHSPTALLAARGLPLARALFGNGFSVPPACSPMPVLRHWEQVPAERCAASEARALDTCNRVLQAFGQAPMAALHELIEASESFLMGWPELDHCGPWRAAAPCASWGQLPSLHRGLSPSWPAGAGPRVFGYLQRAHPSIDAVLTGLRAGPWRSLIYLAGVSDEEARHLSNPMLSVVTQLLDLPQVLAESALFLSHANTGSTYAALSAGVPCVMLPHHVEQMLLARRVAAVGAGAWLWPEEAAAGLARALQAVLSSPGFQQAARSLAARHVADRDVLAAVADRCEQLAAQAQAQGWPDAQALSAQGR